MATVTCFAKMATWSSDQHYSAHFLGEVQEVTNGPSATIYEVTREANPQIVWQMSVTGKYAYRAFRLPSLYPQPGGIVPKTRR